MLSGYTDAEDIITGINEAGIYEYLLKPWMPSIRQHRAQRLESQALHQHMQHLDLELRAGTLTWRKRSRETLARARRPSHFARIIRTPGGPPETLVVRWPRGLHARPCSVLAAR